MEFEHEKSGPSVPTSELLSFVCSLFSFWREAAQSFAHCIAFKPRIRAVFCSIPNHLHTHHHLPSSATLQPTNLLFHVCWASRLLPGLDHTIRYSVHNSAVSEVMQCWWLCCIRCWGCGVVPTERCPHCHSDGHPARRDGWTNIGNRLHHQQRSNQTGLLSRKKEIFSLLLHSVTKFT